MRNATCLRVTVDGVGDRVEAPVGLLSYADEITQTGVRVVREPGVVRIILPPTWRWWPTSGGLVFLLLAIIFVAGVTVVAVRDSAKISALSRSLRGVEGCGFIVALAAVGIAQTRQESIFEVTGDRLVAMMTTFGRIREVSSWPRRDILDIHYSRISKKVILRARGRDMLELALSSSPLTHQYLADQLNAAFGEIPLGTVSPDQSASIAGRHSGWRGRLLRVTIAIVCMSVVCIQFGRAGLLDCGLSLVGAAVVVGVRWRRMRRLINRMKEIADE